MYKIVKLNSSQEKMKHVLKQMTLLKYRQLETSELEKIYLTLINMIDITNCHSDLFKDIAKSLFIINHYYQINQSHDLLLESLHLCKLNALNDIKLKQLIDDCITIVGNFEINSTLTQSIANIMLLADFYFQTTDIHYVAETTFFDFIRTSINSTNFDTTSFCLTIESCLEENEYTDKPWLNLFLTLKNLLNNDDTYYNYTEFIRWYIK